MSISSITTRTGDHGQTKLFSGETVSKNSPRLEAYGDLDELVSLLSLARHHTTTTSFQDDLLWLQRGLFTIGSELATSLPHLQRLKKRADRQLLAEMEQRRTALEAKVSLPQGFVIPGNSVGSAYLDYARAVSRRLERKVIALSEAKEIDNPVLLVWLNRLSDYLYLMARYEEKKSLLVKE